MCENWNATINMCENWNATINMCENWNATTTVCHGILSCNASTVLLL